jgi:hypothetical protein
MSASMRDRAPKGRNETGIWWRRHDESRSSGVSPNGRLRLYSIVREGPLL